ncbi:MAG: 4Fe-4S binding protein [Dehalococcoidia bacterium]|nr:4Fe-4S binding protein [Dehalococcoidia bacterium]MDH4367110.1 4Fe-4S binding protein [Dehalococcoidia bacterium]
MAEAYAVLAGKLGYAGSERLGKLLKRLMDKEEAELVTSLPCSVAELAQKLGKDEADVNKMLKGLFEKGVIFMTSKGYQFARDIFQFHDATACDVRSDKVWGPELLDLWEDFLQAEWYADWAKMVQTWKMPLWRVLPATRAISKGTKLLPSEDMTAILDQATKFALVNCSCRRIARRCDLPAEVCLQVNRGAEYAIARGTGRELTKDEAMKIMDVSEEAGLVHSVFNVAGAFNVICNCCGDCCVFYYPLAKYGVLEKGVARSRFQAQVDKLVCKGCQTCVERCPFEAVEMVKISGEKKLKAQISSEKCFGCGVCAVGCESEAIKLVEVRPPEYIPV